MRAAYLEEKVMCGHTRGGAQHDALGEVKELGRRLALGEQHGIGASRRLTRIPPLLPWEGSERAGTHVGSPQRLSR